MKAIVFAVALVCVASPTLGASLFSYPMNFGQATIHDQGRTFTLWVHPKENRILLEVPPGEAVFKKPTKWPIEYWRHAAEIFVAPVGCGIQDVDVNWREGAAWEATFVCPPGVDLRALVKAQSPALKKGVPLQPPAPTSSTPTQ